VSTRLGQAQDHLAKALSSASGGLVLVTIEVPKGDFAELWSVWPERTAFAYRAPRRTDGAEEDGQSLVGLSSAAEYRSSGLGAADALRWTRRLLARIARPADRRQSRLLCTCAFSPASPRSGIWRRFAGLRVVLPRWTHTTGRGISRLMLATDIAPETTRRAQAELEELWAALEAPALRVQTPAAHAVRDTPRASWNSLMQAGLAAIEDRRFQKLVLARSAVVRGRVAWDSASVLGRLAREAGCTAFAVRQGDSTFLGATPERLIERRGDTAVAEALAGTSRRGHGGLAGDKLQREHQVVVEEIDKCLASFGPTKRSRPVVRRLADMVHRLTLIRTRLTRDAHVLDLGLRLHPTPAVSGAPKRAAVRWIDAHEPARGLYAGFVGWFDARGWGELSVAIRSGLLRGKEARVFTGAGVVRGSSADDEFAETALKQRPFLRALGVSA
jgi:isochorismate synthase